MSCPRCAAADARCQHRRPIAVTGASGFLGGHVVRRLIAEGYRVRALVFEPERADRVAGWGAEVVVGALEPDALHQLMDGCGGVFHIAGVVSLSSAGAAACQAVNVEGTRTVFEAARAAGIARVVHTSTSMCIGASHHDSLLDESSPFELHDAPFPYVLTKKAGERIALSHDGDGMEVVVCCPAGIVGPEDPFGSEANSIFTRYLDGQLRFLVKHWNTWGDVRDIAAGHIAAFERGRAGERYILGGHIGSVLDFARRIDRAAGGGRPPIAVLPNWLLGLVARGMEFMMRNPPLTRDLVAYLRYRVCISSDKACAELGYSPRPFDETVADALEWHRDAHG